MVEAAPELDDTIEAGDDGAAHAFWAWLTRQRAAPGDLDDPAVVAALVERFEADR